jgi:ELWxxDGT repeat protein
MPLRSATSWSSVKKAHGTEPWVSDGTEAGTHLLRDINPGSNNSAPGDLTPAAGLAYFNAADGVHGVELWSTDGTEAGTVLVADIDPTGSGFPSRFGAAGSRLFFSASQPATGQEAWALPLPPQLSIGDTVAVEGTTALLTVTLTSSANQPVHADYATSDGTAVAGKDYDPVSGTLTFAAGESSRTIAVPVHGNGTPENNRNFFVTLSNASGAVITRPAGSTMIEDDDQSADVALSLDFSDLLNSNVNVVAANNGPSAATDLKLKVTHSGGSLPQSCNPCQITALQLASGAAAKEQTVRVVGIQQYFSATASGRQHDPQTSNNSVAWTASTYIAMDALYLTPGADANVWFKSPNAAVTISSSNPAAVSVPASIPAGATPSFVVHGIAAGSSTITLNAAGLPFALGSLNIDVVAAGTHLRYPDAFDVNVDNGNAPHPFDQPMYVRIDAIGRAPLTGDTATGLVTISENGQELGRGTLFSGTLITRVPFSVPTVGLHTVTFNYAGDANFLPISTPLIINVAKGSATILPSVEQTGSTVTLHLHVNGSPQYPPTGTVTITEAGGMGPLQAVLSDGEAVVTLSGLSGGRHTLIVSYPGEARYGAATQTVVVTIGGRHRAAGH